MKNNRALFLGGEFVKKNGNGSSSNERSANKILTLEQTLIA